MQKLYWNVSDYLCNGEAIGYIPNKQYKADFTDYHTINKTEKQISWIYSRIIP